jgi:hypothetical protein
MTEEEAKKLAENHWDWLEPIIDKIPFQGVAQKLFNQRGLIIAILPLQV